MKSIDPGFSYGFGTYLCILFAYFSMVVPFTIIDHLNLLPRYKIDPVTNASSAKQRGNGFMYENADIAIKMVLLNFAWLLPATYFSTPVLSRLLLDSESSSNASTTEIRLDNLPSLPFVLIQFAVFFLVDDVCFYIYHRILHEIPWLYKNFHKPHHKFVKVFAIASHAVHPIEMMLQAIGACIGPFGIFYKQTHPIVWYSWLVVRQWQGIEDHIGYNLPFSPTSFLPGVGGSRHHDQHHRYFECNYASVFSFLDDVFGTSYEVWKSKSGKSASRAQADVKND